MQLDIIPRQFWNFPTKIPSLFDEDDFSSFLPSSGLTISEDDKKVYVEAAVPGIDPKDVEVTFDKGVLWIRGEAKEEEEDKKRKFYRKASRSFSYRVAVPNTIDEKIDPDVVCRNGQLIVTFTKLLESEPKKLQVKS